MFSTTAPHSEQIACVHHGILSSSVTRSRLYRRRERVTTKNGLTWREVSSGLGISDHTLARIVNGDKAVRLPIETWWNLEKIAEGALKN